MLDIQKYMSEVSPADATEFSASVRDSLESCSTFETYLTGIPERQFVHCVSHSLEHMAPNTTSPDLGHFLWNPIVASLMKCISALADRVPYGSQPPKPPGHPSSSTQKAKPVVSSKQGKTKQPVQIGKLKQSAPVTPSAGKVVAKKVTFAKVLKAVPPELEQGVKTPSTTRTEVGPSDRLTAYQAINTVRSAQPLPFFNQMRDNKFKGPVTCHLMDCATCGKFFKNIPPTRCVDIRCHKPGACTSSGWYPHVLPHIWAAIKRAHVSASEEIIYVGLPSTRLAPLEIPEPFAPLPRKRPWTMSYREGITTSDSDTEDTTSSKNVVPPCRNSSWAMEAVLEAEMLQLPTAT